MPPCLISATPAPAHHIKTRLLLGSDLPVHLLRYGYLEDKFLYNLTPGHRPVHTATITLSKFVIHPHLFWDEAARTFPEITHHHWPPSLLQLPPPEAE